MSASINTGGGGNSASGGFAENWNMVRPMWNRAPIQPGSGITATVRPPNPGLAPQVVGPIAGLGAGGGVGPGPGSNKASGTFLFYFGPGLAPNGIGSLQLSFPAPFPSPNGWAFTADWCNIVMLFNNPVLLALSWAGVSGFAMPVPNSKPYVLSYQLVDAK